MDCTQKENSMKCAQCGKEVDINHGETMVIFEEVVCSDCAAYRRQFPYSALWAELEKAKEKQKMLYNGFVELYEAHKEYVMWTEKCDKIWEDYYEKVRRL